ncbi:FadR/GntR family transcriptional regulator [Rhizorhabdus wittichii]|uniref:FadR/GntR family transcriptional regulator n=1 Tax=Rhizorhabdus wittichii TaxID=160791 RepID=UPI00178C6752|nr:GntR family transcriptional regulator [Rhizorhabdus wittichii]
MADDSEGLSGFSATMGEDLRLPKLSHLVASRLREQIISGKLKAGSMLLPENKMLAIFNVSRPTLREALRILEAEALISVGRGARTGAMILGPNIQKATEYATTMLVHEGVTMRDLHEARMFFEPAIVRSLKGSALKEAVVHLRACIDGIQLALKERRYLDVLSGTNRFHEELARASGNKTIAVLIGMIRSISDDAYSVNLSTDNGANAEAIERNIAKTAAGYAALCDLLEKGKAEEAADFWALYMGRALDFLNRSKIGDRRLVLPSPGGERPVR